MTTKISTDNIQSSSLEDIVTVDGVQTLTDKTISGLKETKVAVSGTEIDLALGNYFTKTIASSTTFSVIGTASANSVSAFVLELTNGGSAAITWWSGITWVGGTPPTLTSAGVDVLGFFTHDAGTTWRGFVLGLDMRS